MDFSHLDKMGRELKCPICLSLLKSAAMLVCNHVFCNSCIVESMRSGANCPVCKLPFRRREVRPAPHMDNLVSIYKSMEAASGLTIFTTQVAQPKNNEELQITDDRKSNDSKRILMTKNSRSSKRSSKGKRKKMEKFDCRTSDPCSTRPSCSSNKRIHVTPYPVSETPVQQKRSNKLAISTTEGMDRTELENDSTVTYKRLEDHTLQPFFWLREANEEEEGIERIATQDTTGLITPKKNVPCFSDIKDSEDVSTPPKATPTSKSAVQGSFDSEVFEWTQRACSPELFLTPTKKKIAGGENINGFNEDECRAISLRLVGNPKRCNRRENAKTTRISCTRTGSLKKRDKQNKSKKTIGETASISLNEEHPFGSNEVLEDSRQGMKFSKKMDPLSTRKVHTKGRKPTNLYPKSSMTSKLSETNELVDVQKVVPANSSKAIHDIERTSKILGESSHSKSMNVDVAVQNNFKKRTKKASLKSPKKSKRLSSDLAVLEAPDTNLLGDPRNNESRSHELDKANSRRQLSFLKQNGGQTSCRAMVRVDKKCKIDAREQDDQEMLNMQNVDMFAAKTYHKEQHMLTNSSRQEDNLPYLNLQSHATSKAKELHHVPSTEILRKCKNVPSPVKCAFCHSSSDSEVSGEIMHYFNGKSVASDYNEGVNVIHSHRSCTEWAPDVFFNDDLVINLSTELARSRRIACSCCGIKGAALGCFEKSCRRSFHYPCAKQTPECRWDYEHFVMLCPLHSSSKFPSETSELQKRKRTSGSKIEVPPTSQSLDVAERNCKWAWPSRFPCKWVLCSSALSGAEKEILSNFASFTGVSVLKNWSSAITHVIASTDENGACKRTLKFLMGILEGKWIVSIEWIKACMEFMKPVDEEKYEISVDVHGIHSGPRLGRMRIYNKEPKIFTSFWFYFSGDFVASYKGYLHDLIIAAGGKVLQRRPISSAHKKLPDDSSDMTFIVYSLEFPENKRNQDEKVLDNRKAESIALAEDCGAKVVTTYWILESIAASTLQTLPC